MSQPGGGPPPYGDPPTSSPGGNPYALPPNAGSPGYPYGSGGLFPPPEPKKKLSGGAITGIVIGAVVLLLLIAGGVVGVIYWINSGKGSPTAGGPGSATPAASGSAKPSGSASPSGQRDGVADIQVGQCLRQVKGLGGRDTALPAACTEPNTLRVVARFDATTDKGKCRTSGQKYDYTFTHTDDKPAQSYVLCLKNQP
ncbi:LppU/SCO3897 family protein [Fodinicola acaciae]|uniref:LppU/SCO3897 family protein n=1 Tax=Fodinicola acaciae TaxID=2681555 RepID=UPI0013D8B800|nr:hypothetical protein [Fodinicola acaciae]